MQRTLACIAARLQADVLNDVRSWWLWQVIEQVEDMDFGHALIIKESLKLVQMLANQGEDTVGVDDRE
jgi:hypothetical protein